MNIKAIKTRLVHAGEIGVQELLAESIKAISDKSVVAISSKIIALCENRTADLSTDYMQLVKSESEYYLPREFSPYHHTFSIAQGTLIARAGIDESNANGHFVLWPENAMQSAEQIRQFLSTKFGLKSVGVIITDSTCTPLRRGTVGVMIGWSGFMALHDLRGELDLFGREFRIETSNLANSLAAAANIVMGEGAEQTPIAIVSSANFIEFVSRAPTKQEIAATFVGKDEDLFAPFFNLAPWLSGGKKPLL